MDPHRDTRTKTRALLVGGVVAVGIVAAPAAAGAVGTTASTLESGQRLPVAVRVLQAAPVLGPGDQGAAVEQWQDRINTWIEQEAPRRGAIEVTGIYDEATETATIDLQQNLGVTIDGIAGPETRAALAEVIGPAEDQAPAPDDGDAPQIDPGAGPLLTRGSSGPPVADWQTNLNRWRSDAGLDAIASDGLFGSITENATRQFQTARDISVDGIVGPETRGTLQAALEADQPPEEPTAEPPAEGPSGPLLGIGSVGEPVSRWQQELNRWRETQGITPIDVDAYYGPITEDATRQFQAAQDALRVDGIVGPNTRAVADDVIDG